MKKGGVVQDFCTELCTDTKCANSWKTFLSIHETDTHTFQWQSDAAQWPFSKLGASLELTCEKYVAVSHQGETDGWWCVQRFRAEHQNVPTKISKHIKADNKSTLVSVIISGAPMTLFFFCQKLTSSTLTAVVTPPAFSKAQGKLSSPAPSADFNIMNTAPKEPSRGGSAWDADRANRLMLSRASSSMMMSRPPNPDTGTWGNV